ncbi:hypothetical protein Tco_0497932 [Tanacetum coccineum]
MQSYLKSDIVWESGKERLSFLTPQKPALVYHNCQRDPKAPPITLLNQDLFYLKYGKLGAKKYTLSLHKFPVVPFPNDDIEEQTSKWNLWAKQDHIRRQKELRDKPEEFCSESKIIKVIKTSYKLGHEHKFIIEIVVRRANGKIDPIKESDYKYLNKNDIEDLYLLCVNGKVNDYRETGLLGSLTVFIRSIIIWERVHDFELGMEIGMIYENNKQEKRVMIHKFCDATLKRVLERMEKYNKDVKYGYVVPSLSDADVEYLKLYEEEIEDRL